ncbi:penicillin amidase [Geodermatophilus bullaregiensis]|uniref:penicillin acylase family protein n=1 Tax=Geodermatophilus bullaregiensis TaxID=1564160 RepID=UPI0019584872|nr:penicillin acylase family protein [Geodermatophilus bullaregiensis]MBM7809017.1 penicillin amidase [Geodermatophilus bullaregiensis]
MAPDRTSFVLPGLTAPAEVVVDRWGVPHVYAATSDDAFRVQGFTAARDRLWQIDLWRRRGLGQLAEVLGPEHVDRDRAARLFLFRGDAQRDWAAYGPDTEGAATAFVAGVNAFVQLTREDPALLPAEFRQLGYRPALWDPSDVTRIRSHGLFANLREEVARALTLRDHPAAVEDLRRKREPPRPLAVPEGLDLGLIPDDVLAVYDLATLPPVFGAPSPDAARGSVLPEGSNNWVLSGARTATGRPLLANDPHRAAAALPGLRYLVHLSAPGLDVIGAGEPALPGISIGHNGRVAFGLTIFPVDQEDLYVYATDPEDPLRYRYGDGWEAMRVERETIAVRDGEPVEVELLFTRHGPVIRTDPATGTAFAVRAAWLGPGMAPYLGSIEYLRARDGNAFRAAMGRWGAPPENQVYADTGGTIGWTAGGRTPRRPNWDGTLPVPGDGRYEWAGFLDADELPASVDPPSGSIATANEMNLPADFPAERHVSYDWSAPYRRQRIDEVLAATPAATPQDAVALQVDVLSVPARRILTRVRALPLPDDVDGLDLLLGWDVQLRADSAAAALFEVWYRRHLRPALLRRALAQLVAPAAVPDAAARIAGQEDALADARVDVELVEEPGDRLGPDPEQVLAGVVAETVPAAVAEVERLLGPDRERWAWGRLHVARMTHPFAALLSGLPEDQLAVGPLPRGGSGDTVGNTAYGPDFVQTSGATFRIAVDVGAWDESLAMNAPGQSGRLGTPHATDLFGPWARGEAFPLRYSREQVDAAAELRITLHPSPPTA